MTTKIFLTALLMCFMGFVGCKDGEHSTNNKLQEENPLVGTWYEVGSTDTQGIKVVFTETNLTSLHYYKHYLFPDSLLNDTTIMYDKLVYSILSENRILLTGFPDDWSWQFEGKHISEFNFNKDTLFISRFVPNYTTIPYPNNLSDIYLIRSKKNEN